MEGQPGLRKKSPENAHETKQEPRNIKFPGFHDFVLDAISGTSDSCGRLNKHNILHYFS